MSSIFIHILNGVERMASHQAALGAALSVSVALTGCFTGVESTPKITDADVRRSSPAVRQEESYLNGVESESLGSWNANKAFLVTDPKIALVLNNRAANSGPHAGSQLFYRAASASSDITGNPTTLLEFADSAGNRYVYTITQPLDTLFNRYPDIPFTIDLDLVKNVAERMEGKSYWVLTPLWRDERGQSIQTRKYIPVKVTSVRPGNSLYPIAVDIKAAEDSARGTLMLNPDRRGRNNHGFAQLFSLSDPRLAYPNITDRVWKNIIECRVEPGMTRDECRLAVGAPAEIIRQPGYSYLQEAWRYETGLYLIFIDGVLQSVKR